MSFRERLSSLVKQERRGTAWRAANFAAREFPGCDVCIAEAKAAYSALEKQVGFPISDLDADAPLSELLLPRFRLTREDDVNHFLALALAERMKPILGETAGATKPPSTLPNLSMRALVTERSKAVGGCTCPVAGVVAQRRRTTGCS